MQIKSLTLRIPIAYKEYPIPTFSRELTKYNHDKKRVEVYCVECVYWLNQKVISNKQLKWLGDIKQKILRLIPYIEISQCNSEAHYITDSGEVFNLKSLQQVWTRKITPKKKSILSRLNEKKEDDVIVMEELIDTPSLIPMAMSGKSEYDLYTVLCKYASRLHYEKMFQIEYLISVSGIYNSFLEEKVLPKKLLKLTHKAFELLNGEIENNPDNFKQKLNPKELRRLRIKHGATVLQKSNNKRRDANTHIVKEAIATQRYYKADGVTVNVSALSNATNLSRPTLTAIIKSL